MRVEHKSCRRCILGRWRFRTDRSRQSGWV